MHAPAFMALVAYKDAIFFANVLSSCSGRAVGRRGPGASEVGPSAASCCG